MKLGYNKLEVFTSSQSRDKLTNEQRYWKKYETQVVQTYPHTVAAISNNNNPHDLFAYAHGRTIVLRTPGQQTPPREINFVNNLTAICIRPDGAVFASADETGEI